MSTSPPSRVGSTDSESNPPPRRSHLPIDSYNLDEFLLLRVPTIPSYIASGLLQFDSKMMLYGDPKTFKSIASIQLALCLNTGTPWLGFSTAKARTMYLQAELSNFDLQVRLRSMRQQVSQNPNLTPADIIIVTGSPKLDTKLGREELRGLILKHHPHVIIIDPLYKFVTAGGSVPEFISATQDTIDELINLYHVSFVIVHHTRKPFVDGSGKIIRHGALDMRDSRLWEMWAQTIIGIYGDINTDTRTMEFETRSSAVLLQPRTLRFDRQKVWLDVVP